MASLQGTTVNNFLRTLEQVRATGWYGAPTGSSYTGLATEMGVSSGQGYILCYNRDSSSYGVLNLSGSASNLQISGSNINVTSGALQQGGNQVLHAGNYTSYPDATKLPLAGGTMTGTITGVSDTPVSFNGGTCSAASYNYILGGANDGGNKLVVFVNGSTRTADGGVNALTIRNDGGTFILGHASYFTSILGSTIALTGNTTVTGQLNVNHSTPTSALRLYSGGSTVWSLGVGDASGSYFNITADFGSFTINKTNGYVGIGTTSQVARIQLGSGTPTSATDGIQFGSDTSARLYRSASGIITCPGTIAATFSGSGASLTSLTAGNLSGTIPSAVLGNSALFIGTTSIALNRASAAQSLTGVNIDGYANYISAQTNPGGVFNVGLTRPKGASYTTTASTVTGAIKIKMPPGTPVHGMWKMTIKIYEYGSRGNGYTIECGCHLYPSTAYNRYQYAIGVDSNIALTIRYGTDGTSGCVWIGEDATAWSYPQIHVTEFSNGFNNPGSVDWSAGTWGVTIGNIDNSVVVDGPYTIGLPLASTATTASSVTNGVYTTGNQSIAGTKTFTGVTSFSNTSDYQIVLDGSGTTWAGIAWADVNGTDYVWFNGQYKTFSIGGGGANISGKKLHVDGAVTIGANLGSTAVISNSLNLQGPLQMGNYKTYIFSDLSAASTQARTYEIARIGIDYNDWNSVGTFEVELHEKYYGRGLKKVYNIWYGYVSSSGIRLVEFRGDGFANNFQCRISGEITVAGDQRYISVFIDVRNYGIVDVVVKTNRNYTATANPEIGYTYINLAPTPTNISDFTADSDLEISTLGTAKLGGNTILTSATTSAPSLSIGGSSGSVAALGVKTGALDANIVTFAKMQQVTGPVAIGRTTATLGDMTTLSGADLAAIIGANTITNATNATTCSGNAGSVTYLPNRTDSTAYPVVWGAAYTNGSGTIAYSCAAVTIQSSTGTLAATAFSGSGASLTSLTAGNLTGTIPSAVLGNSAHFIGTTSITLNRASASQSLTGVSIDGSSGSCTGNAVTATTASALTTTNSYTIAGLTSNGDIYSSTTSTSGAYYFNSTGHGLRRSDGTNNVYLFTTTGNLYLGTTGSSSQQIIINNNGNLGVGTSPTSYKLDVNGSCHATSFPTSSDARFKKNIKPLENCVDKVKKMQGVSYEWNEFINNRRDGYGLNIPVLGVIAQDLEKVIPEVVSKWHLSDDCEDARAVDYIRIIPVLIEAIKEQQVELDDLKNRLIKLENK